LQGKPKYSKKICPSATLSTTNLTLPDLGSNPYRRGGKPATDRLSYGPAMNLPLITFYTSSLCNQRSWKPIYPWLYSPCGPWPLFQFLNIYTVGRTPWTGDKPVARSLPTHRTTQTRYKRTQICIPRVGFEPTIPVLERAKTVHATVVGKFEAYRYINRD
jgi:hypothetical protein